MQRHRWVPFWMGVVVAVGGMAALGGAVLAEPATPAVECTWGASSVEATLVDGRWVVAEPETSGCVPEQPE